MLVLVPIILITLFLRLENSNFFALDTFIVVFHAYLFQDLEKNNINIEPEVIFKIENHLHDGNNGMQKTKRI